MVAVLKLSVAAKLDLKNERSHDDMIVLGHWLTAQTCVYQQELKSKQNHSFELAFSAAFESDLQRFMFRRVGL